MKKLFILSTMVILLSGCATYYSVRVNDYLNTQAGGIFIPENSGFYVLENRDEANPLLGSQVRFKIERLLADKGYRITAYESADFLISFSYSINSGREVTEVRPVHTPGQSATIQTFSSSGRGYTSYVTSSGHTSYVPYRVTVFTSNLVLEIIQAGAFRGRNEKKLIWLSQNSTTTRNSDLRGILNYLLVAAFEYFAKDTERAVIINIPEKDPKVEKLRRL